MLLPPPTPGPVAGIPSPDGGVFSGKGEGGGGPPAGSEGAGNDTGGGGCGGDGNGDEVGRD